MAEFNKSDLVERLNQAVDDLGGIAPSVEDNSYNDCVKCIDTLVKDYNMLEQTELEWAKAQAQVDATAAQNDLKKDELDIKSRELNIREQQIVAEADAVKKKAVVMCGVSLVAAVGSHLMAKDRVEQVYQLSQDIVPRKSLSETLRNSSKNCVELASRLVNWR